MILHELGGVVVMVVTMQCVQTLVLAERLVDAIVLVQMTVWVVKQLVM
jgi:hypothetical protein